MKFRVIHEDYWPVPETIQDNLTIDQARELLHTIQKENLYIPIKSIIEIQ